MPLYSGQHEEQNNLGKMNFPISQLYTYVSACAHMVCTHRHTHTFRKFPNSRITINICALCIQEHSRQKDQIEQETIYFKDNPLIGTFIPLPSPSSPSFFPLPSPCLPEWTFTHHSLFCKKSAWNGHSSRS